MCGCGKSSPDVLYVQQKGNEKKKEIFYVNVK